MPKRLSDGMLMVLRSAAQQKWVGHPGSAGSTDACLRQKLVEYVHGAAFAYRLTTEGTDALITEEALRRRQPSRGQYEHRILSMLIATVRAATPEALGLTAPANATDGRRQQAATDKVIEMLADLVYRRPV